MHLPFRLCELQIFISSRDNSEPEERKTRPIELVPYHGTDEEQPGILLSPEEAAKLGGLLIAAASVAVSIARDEGNLFAELPALQEYRVESPTE